MLPKCRLCGAELTHTFVDLGMSPLCESYVSAERLDDAESFYPLHVRLCESCLLVQLPAYVAGEDIFSDYAYFFVVLRFMGGARRAVRRGNDQPAWPRFRQPGHRGREQ